MIRDKDKRNNPTNWELYLTHCTPVHLSCTVLRHWWYIRLVRLHSTDWTSCPRISNNNSISACMSHSAASSHQPLMCCCCCNSSIIDYVTVERSTGHHCTIAAQTACHWRKIRCQLPCIVKSQKHIAMYLTERFYDCIYHVCICLLTKQNSVFACPVEYHSYF